MICPIASSRCSCWTSASAIIPLLDLSAQLLVHLIQFARSSFKAALERFFDTLVIGDVECDPVKRNRRVVRENGLPKRRDPAFHPVRFSNYSVLDIVQPIAPWVGALLQHHISIDVLRASFFDLKRTAPGVDQMTWAEYMGNIEANLANLHRRVHTGAYPAPSRRVDTRRRMATTAARHPDMDFIMHLVQLGSGDGEAMRDELATQSRSL